LLIVVVVWLWVTNRRAAIPFFGIIGVLDLWNIPLRDIIDRPRPTQDLVGVVIGYGGIQGDSFPSGHALHITLFYGYVAYLLRDFMKASPLRTALWTAMGIYSILGGVWLIYAGRHWFSDVIGGYVYGAFYLTLLILVYRWYVPWSQRVYASLVARAPASFQARALTWAMSNVI